jgi:hypothetical protein
MYDPGNPGSTEDFVEIKFDQTGKGTKGWYLGPLDPSLQAIDSAQEAPIFEYSFHTPKTEVSVSRPPYLSLRVMDERDHVRYFHLNFNVIDVKTEFRSYDGQNSVNRSTRSTTE